MMDVLEIAIQISPILFMVAAIACTPLLSDGRPDVRAPPRCSNERKSCS
jgi:hypothetical protein